MQLLETEQNNESHNSLDKSVTIDFEALFNFRTY